jgi:hypothetical protein
MRLVLSTFMILFFLLRTQNLNAAGHMITLPSIDDKISHENKLFIGNGREFKKQNYSYVIDGKTYPIYRDKKGVEAYNFGMIVLELKHIEDYHIATGWSVSADDVTFYEDLGITLLEFKDPHQAEVAFLKLTEARDPNILYMELALIELD